MITHFKGNRSPSISDTIRVDGAAFDLTGSTVKFKMRPLSSSTLKVDAAAVVVTAAAGIVRYDWVSGDVDTAGVYLCWWEVTLPSSKLQNTPQAELVMLDPAPSAVTNYIDRETLKPTLNLVGETYADADIDAAISAASRAIDGYCSRRFYADADATQVRYYTPMSAQFLYIDDLITLTTIKTDSNGDGVFENTWTQQTDFVLEPLNAAANGKPYTTVRRMQNGTQSFWDAPRSVEVTGKFGWAAVPAEVIEATTILASRLFRRAREAPFGIIVAGLDVAAASRLSRVDPDVAQMLGPYIRGPFVA